MYCHNCGKEVDVNKLEAKRSSFANDIEYDSNAKIEYVCPRCGHLMHDNLSNAEIKQLSSASHAQLQRGRNYFASGMGAAILGLILLALAIIFFVLAKKPSNQYQLVTTCAEFYVSIALFSLSFVLLICGIVYVIIAINKKRKYHALLKEINNKTFVQ